MSQDHDLAERLSFMQIDTQTQGLLSELKPLVKENLKPVLTEFYAHIAKFSAPSSFFHSKELQQHAADRQFEHWMTILEGNFDETYLKSAVAIGMAHARIGLEPRWYIAGYNFIISRILPKIAANQLGKRGKGSASMRKMEALQAAFLSAAMLDMDFAISVYASKTDENNRQKLMTGWADEFEKKISGIVETVAAASVELEHTAKSMSSIAEQTSSRSVSVSAAMEQATTNVTSVANSADEMGNAVSEISQQVNHATKIAASAVSTAQTTNETMEKLSVSAEKVGQVVSLISDIAAQTNLLALNATIESARAGEAGRGFAVVASEVKSLATQTGKATEDIAAQIQEIQSITAQSVAAINQIHQTISEINQVSMAINAAVEEQSTSTREIARNTREAADGTREVTSHIAGVQQGATETGSAAAQVVSASSELGSQADRLRQEVSKFLTSIRAA